MIGASAYIAWCSAKNRVRVRLRRLREPRYLIGAIVGVAYFYLTIFARGRRPGVRVNGRGGGPPALPAQFALGAAAIGGLGALALSLLMWLGTAKSGLLDFSEAEREMLFSAPVSRRQLLVHRIIRSQFGSLFASVLIALFATPVTGSGRIRLAIGVWIVLLTARIYYAAVSLSRARLQSRAASTRLLARLPLAFLLVALLVVVTNIVREFRDVVVAGPGDVFVHLTRVASAGMPRVVLWPFAAVARAPFAGASADVVSGLLPALLVLAVVTAWLLASSDAVDAVAGQGGGPQEKIEKRAAKVPQAARSVGWTLPLHGRPELALFWKGATEMVRGTSANALRIAIPLLVVIVGMTSAMMGASGMRQPAGVVSLVCGLLAGVSILFGPQMMRTDLRTDLQHLELLKTWPMRAAEVIRGEMAWPVAFVSLFASAAIVTSALFSGTALPNQPFVDRWSLAIAVIVAGPALVSAQFAVHNMTAILFPGWVQLGSQRTRGIDAMGQRLIMLAAVLVSLIAFSLPGAIAGGVIWLALHRLVGNVVLVPAAVAFSVIVLVEVLLVTELLGPAYEKIDVTSIERPE